MFKKIAVLPEDLPILICTAYRGLSRHRRSVQPSDTICDCCERRKAIENVKAC